MTSKKECKILAEKIKEIIEDGIILNENALHFMDSTCSISSGSELETVLKDEENSDRDVLLELIFFPDEEVRLKVEPLLTDHLFTREDERIVIRSLRQTGISAKIIFPGSGDTFPVTMPEFSMESFVTRLYIHRNPHPDVSDALEQYLPAPVATLARTRLRCTGGSFTGEKADFLCRFLKNTAEKQDNFMEMFDFALANLNNIPENQNIETALFQEREQLVKTRETIKQFNETLKKSSMEALMLQGFIIPPESLETVSEKIDLMDIILQENAGPQPLFNNAPQQKDLGQFDGKTEFEKVIRLLS